MLDIIHRYFNKSISRLVMASFVFVLLLPLGFLITSLPEESWGSVKQKILEKHLLVAKGIEGSIKTYLSSQQQLMQVFGHSVGIATIRDERKLQAELDGFMKSFDGAVAISFLSLDSYGKATAIRDVYKMRLAMSQGETAPYVKYLTFGNRHSSIPAVSAVFKSQFSKTPVVLVKSYILDNRGRRRGMLLAELSVDYINDICQSVVTGSGKNQCMVVDSLGKIISHSNPDWVGDMRDMSTLAVVQKIRVGNSGTMTYQSPERADEDIAGFSTMEKIGWGVVISEPKGELDSPVNQVIITVFKWLVIGIILSLGIAYMLTQQVVKPINSLVRRSEEADIRSDSFNLGVVPKNTPIEISKLWVAISSLVARLQITNKKVKKLNFSLEKDIEEATKKLRATNKYLYKISSNDHLTEIANRRYFEDTVRRTLKTKKGERASIILIDVDKFKFINDEYGHEAGDVALKHIARLMKKCTRQGDLPARLGGDEFVIYIKNCSAATLDKIANNLRKTVESTPMRWGNKKIPLSLSIGTVNYPINGKAKLNQLLKLADKAMYLSKERGRNHVTAYSFAQKKRKAKPMRKVARAS